MRPAPYYEHNGVTLYCGDSREILPLLDPVDAIITDPVWPNSDKELVGADRPFELFAEVAQHFPRLAQRLIVHLGCLSDPRILASVPKELPFVRVCWMRHIPAGYRGTLVNDADVAYVFGHKRPTQNDHVIPGMCDGMLKYKVPLGHPCPRRLEHLNWLIAKFTDPGQTVLDPFAGVGTTLIAAKNAGRKAIGIEIEEKHCKTTIRRLAQDVFDFYMGTKNDKTTAGTGSLFPNLKDPGGNSVGNRAQ